MDFAVFDFKFFMTDMGHEQPKHISIMVSKISCKTNLTPVNFYFEHCYYTIDNS